MRPVERGAAPSVGGSLKVVRDYGELREDLLAALDAYCSYCEAPLTAKPEVEHISPKARHADARVDWNNLLLACGFCNPEKGSRDVDRSHDTDYVWPDRDNTFRAFVYGPGGTLKPTPTLPSELQKRAMRTRDLVGLNGPHLLLATDARKRRWNVRRQAWDRIQEARADLHACDTPEMRRQILAHAKTMGFWSMWMALFADDNTMCAALLDLLRGTSRACFDARGRPIPRPGGVL
mgnify:CR=1 FL=1